jgi:hypothetical protein
MKVSELIERLSMIEQDKEIRFQELDQGYELYITEITLGTQGDWYVIS